jgi:hypothetical protein
LKECRKDRKQRERPKDRNNERKRKESRTDRNLYGSRSQIKSASDTKGFQKWHLLCSLHWPIVLHIGLVDWVCTDSLEQC